MTFAVDFRPWKKIKIPWLSSHHRYVGKSSTHFATSSQFVRLLRNLLTVRCANNSLTWLSATSFFFFFFNVNGWDFVLEEQVETHGEGEQMSTWAYTLRAPRMTVTELWHPRCTAPESPPVNFNWKCKIQNYLLQTVSFFFFSNRLNELRFIFSHLDRVNQPKKGSHKLIRPPTENGNCFCFCELRTPSAHQDSIHLTRSYKIFHTTTEKRTQKTSLHIVAWTMAVQWAVREDKRWLCFG